MLNSFIFRFFDDLRGTSAVEFALIVPVLLMSLLGVIDLGNAVYQRSDLESALRSGIQYFMSGGEDLAKAQEVVDVSWTHRPEGAVVLAEKFCMCGTVVHACNALCDDDTYPVSYSRISVSATIVGILTDETYETQQTVRVR
jgi:Flp pilus assembly pilin Flp